MNIVLKLSAESQAFINNIASGGRGASKEVSIALARAVAYSLPLEIPTESSEIAGLYRNQRRGKVEEVISYINEVVSLDVNSVLSYTEKFYSHRLEVATLNSPVLALKSETAVVDFFKIGKYFDPDMLTVLAGDPVFITGTTNQFTNLLKQL